MMKRTHGCVLAGADGSIVAESEALGEDVVAAKIESLADPRG